MRLTTDKVRVAVSAFLSVIAIPAFAGGKMVVSQIYAAGGQMGAIYKNNFVEIKNIGDADVNISGWSLQYAKSGDTNWQVTKIEQGIVKPDETFIIQEGGGSEGTLELPRHDAR